MCKFWFVFFLLFNLSFADVYETHDEYCSNYVAWIHLQSLKVNQDEFKQYSIVKLALYLEEIKKFQHLFSISEKQSLNLLEQKLYSQYSFLGEQTNYFQATGPVEESYLEQKVHLSRPMVSMHELYQNVMTITSSVPELGKKIERSLKLNQWDLFLLQNEEHVQRMKRDYSLPKKDLSSNFQFLSKKLESDVNDILAQNISYYHDRCPENSQSFLVNKYQLKCSENYTQKDLMSFDTGDLSILLNSEEFKNLIQQKKIVPPIKIETSLWPQIDSQKNKRNLMTRELKDSSSYYCKRDTNILTTLIFHHTFTDSKATIESINDKHVTKDKYYMIGYHYLIAGTSEASIYQGRPDWMKGAHAGAESSLKNEDEYKHVKDSLPTEGLECGNYQAFKSRRTVIKKDELYEEEGISANATSIGVALVGDYSGRKKPNNNVILQAAKLACNLQKLYPNIKTIGGHRQYKWKYKAGHIFNKTKQCFEKYNKEVAKFNEVGGTSCPGNLMMDPLREIASQAKLYGCDFSVNEKWIYPNCLANGGSE